MSGFVLAFARALGEFGATLMVAGNIPGQTQTIPPAIYFAVEAGDKATANTLVGIVTVFCFLLIFMVNCAGLRSPRDGSIELNGRILYSSRLNINIPARHRRIGYLFQDYALFPHMTVKQNVLYGLRGRRMQNKKALLLLDEPFSALDYQSKNNLRQVILGLKDEWRIPMVIVSHDEEDAGLLGDIIISLDKGQVIQRGDVEKAYRRDEFHQGGELI